MSRNIILGGLFVVWGLAILINRLAAGGGDEGSGAYNVGQDAAFYFAMVMVGVGSFALRKGLRERAVRNAPTAVTPGEARLPTSEAEARDRAREESSVGPPTG
jgi:hypothetical protein